MDWLVTLIKQWMFGKTTTLSNQDFIAMFGDNPSVEVMQRVRTAKLDQKKQEYLLEQQKLRKALVKRAKEGIRDSILKGQSRYVMSIHDLRNTYGNITNDVFNLETFAELVQPGLTVSWMSGTRNMIIFEVH